MSSPRLLAEEMEASPHNNGEKTSNPGPRLSDYSNQGCIMQCASEGLPLIFDKGRNTKQGRSCNNGRSPHRTGSGLTYVSVLMIVDPGFVRWISEIRFHGRIHPSAAITASCVNRCKNLGQVSRIVMAVSASPKKRIKRIRVQPEQFTKGVC